MLLEDVISFLKKVPPFQDLKDRDLQAVVRNLSMEFYPKDSVIMQQNGPPSDALRIIKKGSIKIAISSPDGGEVVVDYRGEGETFGFLSMVGKDRVRANVVAVDDTICFLLGKEMVMQLLDSHLAFTEHFLKSHITRYIDRSYQDLLDRSLFSGGSDRLLFTTRVGDMSIKEVVTAVESIAIREAAQIMAKRNVSSVVIVDGNDLPVGIMTDRDLRDKVVASGRDVREPVKNIMSTTLVRVDSRDYCFEAVLKMIRHNIHHIIVIRDGRLFGVMTNHDFMILQGTSPLSLTKDIESQHSIEGLVPASGKINSIIGLLLKEGARAINITTVITELNDRVVRKVLNIAEKRFGQPPVPYCWIGFGSEGRKEQTFKTGQDNAIIHADLPPDMDEEEVKGYFAAFAAFVRDGLVQCGFPSSSANYMASNPHWCQPLSTWKWYFTHWVDTATPEALAHCVVLVDFRTLYGDLALGEALRDHLSGLIQGQKVFLGHIANLAVRNKPPIGFLKSFVVEKDGAHKDELNLKLKGLEPLADIARLFSLERGVRETSTLERLEVLRESNTIVQEYADEFGHAFEFMILLLIHHQHAQISRGEAPDNFINPNNLSNLEKRSIKEAFTLIEKIQARLIERYKQAIW